MVSGRKVMIIGPFQSGTAPTHGASVKNRHLAQRLRECGYEVLCKDTEEWRRHPAILFSILFSALSLGKEDTIVVSVSRQSAYRLISLFRRLPLKAKVCYWVIGGRLDEDIESGKFRLSVLDFPDSIIVETEGMARRLRNRGLDNVTIIPNFKPLSHIPEIPDKSASGWLRCLYLGRIDDQKGCGLILEALAFLSSPGEHSTTANEMQHGDYKEIKVDFIGEITQEYRVRFMEQLSRQSAADYLGFLDLSDAKNYAVVANYDVMLFPTRWISEGHAGVLIDALATGLPVIATRHNDLPELIDDGKTGLLIPAGDSKALADALVKVASGNNLLRQMREECLKRRMKYDVSNVLSVELLRHLFG